MKLIKKVFWIIVTVLWTIMASETTAIVFIIGPLWFWSLKANNCFDKLMGWFGSQAEFLANKITALA